MIWALVGLALALGTVAFIVVKQRRRIRDLKEENRKIRKNRDAIKEYVDKVCEIDGVERELLDRLKDDNDEESRRVALDLARRNNDRVPDDGD